MPETRRKYDPEFREGAVRIVRETGKPIAPGGAGSSGSTRARWVNWVDRERVERGEKDGLYGRRTRRAAAGCARTIAELRMEREVLIWASMGGAGHRWLVRRERRGTASMSCHLMACLSWSPSSLPDACQRSSGSPRRWPVVLPVDGQAGSPGTATGFPAVR